MAEAGVAIAGVIVVQNVVVDLNMLSSSELSSARW